MKIKEKTPKIFKQTSLPYTLQMYMKIITNEGIKIVNKL